MKFGRLIWKIAFIAIIVLLVFAVLITVSIVSYRDSEAYAECLYSADAYGNHTFTMQIKNKRIRVEDGLYEFNTGEDKNEVFAALGNEVEVFEYREETVVFIYSGEVFSLYYLGNNDYSLKNERMVCGNAENTVSIPYPSYLLNIQIDNEGYYPRNFAAGCDLDYLKRFFACYENVTIKNNIFTIDDTENARKIKITYENGIITVE